jgi:RNA polymerase sigma factor FliA
MRKLEQSLWERYRERGDLEARRLLLDQHLGLVHHIARQIAERVPDGVELDDLISAGTLGLVLALESFEPARKLAFSTYATPRIRGSILDDLRSRDWVPRSVRSKSRRIAAAVAQLEAVLGRQPEPFEIARVLGLDVATYWKWQEDTENAVLLPLDGPIGTRDQESATLEETLGDPGARKPDAEVTKIEEVEALRGAIGELPPKERTVLSLYYYEELNLRQIAEVLHLTESRISQIRTQALNRLQGMLRPEMATARTA